uniref:B box-type domain-containing protein n=1 Tax=Magallana gigas TaxID=29159 RepID=A0A8W8IFE4_MAGGI
MASFFRSPDGCSIHREEKYIAVCNSCEKSVCMLCMILHQGHSFTDNGQALGVYKGKLLADGLLITIQNRGRELREELDRLIHEMTKTIKDSKKANMDKIHTAHHTVKRRHSQLNSLIKQAKAEINRNNIHNVLSLYNNINDAIDGYNTNSQDTQIDFQYYKFIAGELRKENLEEMFGKLEAEVKKSNQENPYEYVEPARTCSLKQDHADTEIMCQFKACEKGIASICPFKEDRAFLRDNTGKDIKLIKESGKVLRSLTTNTKKSDVAITLHRCGIGRFLGLQCEFRQQKISQEIFQEGETIQTIESVNKTLTNGNKPLIVSPYKVRLSQYTGDIGVVNWTGPNQGNVLVFGTYGTLKYTYPHKTDVTFEPHDITFDSQNQSVVADAVSQLLHLLSAEGDLLRTIYQCDNTPWSLGYFGRGKLWVGQSDGTVSAIRYKFSTDKR